MSTMTGSIAIIAARSQVAQQARTPEWKAPPEGSAKKPCHLHGSNSKHSYSKCLENLQNCAANNNNNYNAKKHAHDAHHHDNCRHSSGEEEAYKSSAGPTYSNGQVSASESRNGTPAENYHLENYHIPKKVRMDDVGHKSPKSKTAFGAIVNQTQKKEKKSSSSTRMASSSEPKLNFEEFFPTT